MHEIGIILPPTQATRRTIAIPPNWRKMTERMKELDLHGLTVAQAEEIFHDHLNQARMEAKLIELQFITGVGKIRDRFVELAEEQGLRNYIPLNNRGCIVIEFE